MLTKRDRVSQTLAKKLISAMHSAPTNAQLAKAAGYSVTAGAIATEVNKAVKAVIKSSKGKKLRGSNDHVTSPPVSMGTHMTSFTAQTTPTRGGVRIKYRELLNGSLNGSSTFPAFTNPLPTGAGVYELNPGLSKTFPWLAVQAVQYEQYRIHSLSFKYVPFVNTLQSGSVMMMVDYNSLDAPPLTEQQFLDHPGAVIGSVWEAVEFRADARNMHAIGPRKFVRPCAIAGDLKTYDVGKMYIAMSNGAGQPMGKLFVEYDIEFYTPQLVQAPSYAPTTVSYFAIDAITGPQSFTTTVTKNVDWLTLNYNPLNIARIGPGSYVPPAGTYAITITFTIKSTTTLSAASFGLALDGTNIGAVNDIVYFSSLANDVNNVSFTAMRVVPCNGTNVITFVGSIAGGGTLTIPQAFIKWEVV